MSEFLVVCLATRSREGDAALLQLRPRLRNEMKWLFEYQKLTGNYYLFSEARPPASRLATRVWGGDHYLQRTPNGIRSSSVSFPNIVVCVDAPIPYLSASGSWRRWALVSRRCTLAKGLFIHEHLAQ